VNGVAAILLHVLDICHPCALVANICTVFVIRLRMLISCTQAIDANISSIGYIDSYRDGPIESAANYLRARLAKPSISSQVHDALVCSISTNPSRLVTVTAPEETDNSTTLLPSVSSVAMSISLAMVLQIPHNSSHSRAMHYVRGLRAAVDIKPAF